MRVKLIARRGQSALIEWLDQDQRIRRAYIPAGELQPAEGIGAYDVADPELGVPYGIPFAELLSLTATPEEIEAALHQYGIWTAEDIAKRHPQALAALQSVYVRDLVALSRSARDYHRQSSSAIIE